MAGKRLIVYHKIIITLMPVCVALICFLSCGDTKVVRNIATADSLTEVNQQEAVRYIDSVARADKGMSRNDRMKLQLLRMKALNKTDCPLDTDTLASLVKYFDRMVRLTTGCWQTTSSDVIIYVKAIRRRPCATYTLRPMQPTRPMPAATGAHCIRFTYTRLSS